MTPLLPEVLLAVVLITATESVPCSGHRVSSKLPYSTFIPTPLFSLFPKLTLPPTPAQTNEVEKIPITYLPSLTIQLLYSLLLPLVRRIEGTFTRLKS